MLGGSWGSILMLAYAERHPNRVAEIVLFGVTTGRRKEFDWWFQWPPVPHLSPRFADPAFALAFARLVTHYVRHNAWLEDGILLRGAGALAGIPGILVQARWDFQSPVAWAWDLTRAWPRAKLVVVDTIGHAANTAAITDGLVQATDHFAMRQETVPRRPFGRKAHRRSRAAPDPPRSHGASETDHREATPT